MFKSKILFMILAILIILASKSRANPITAAPPSVFSQGHGQKCDQFGSFSCLETSGTCYTGPNGYIGCCTVSDCLARTTCVPYAALTTSPDIDHGGSIACTEQTLPSCVTITNVVASQFIMYCDVQGGEYIWSYVNSYTTGSMADAPSIASKTVALTSTMSASTTAAKPGSTLATIASATSTLGMSMTLSSSPSMSSSTSDNSTITSTSTLSDGAKVAIGIGGFLTLSIFAILMFACNNWWVENKHNPDVLDYPRLVFQRIREYLVGFGTLFFKTRNNTRDVKPAQPNNLSKVYSSIRAGRLNKLNNSLGLAEMDASAGSSPAPNNSQGRQELCASPAPCSSPGSTYELSSTVRPVLPSPAAVSHSSEYSCNGPHLSRDDLNSDGVSPLLSGNSPEMNTSSFSMTPLMSKWQADTPSVGDKPSPSMSPSATIGGPINWPSAEYLKPSSRPSSISHALTSANGGNGYISPEAAMAEGFSAGSLKGDR